MADIGREFQITYFLSMALQSDIDNLYSEKTETGIMKYNDISVFSNVINPKHLLEIEVKSSVTTKVSNGHLIKATSQILATYVLGFRDKYTKQTIVFTDHPYDKSKIISYLEKWSDKIISEANKFINNKNKLASIEQTKATEANYGDFKHIVSVINFTNVKNDLSKNGDDWYQIKYFDEKKKNFIDIISKQDPSIEITHILYVYNLLKAAFLSTMNGDIWINKIIIMNYIKYNEFLSFEAKSYVYRELRKIGSSINAAKKKEVEKFIVEEMKDHNSDEYAKFRIKFVANGMEEDSIIDYNMTPINEIVYFLLWKGKQ